ncbi:hypothetical protein BLNAU_4445 [Blattamonas nauphoetae]|uniref:Uncharacterized protein n=1 Tax=Blattamonas nauphoetae TaxID=2049346 RepID=A0ABQ9Y9Y7_9EUKA|nr:hypothetical protein BLNAU_4445 [Blattamonas nauphoetae]
MSLTGSLLSIQHRDCPIYQVKHNKSLPQTARRLLGDVVSIAFLLVSAMLCPFPIASNIPISSFISFSILLCRHEDNTIPPFVLTSSCSLSALLSLSSLQLLGIAIASAMSSHSFLLSPFTVVALALATVMSIFFHASHVILTKHIHQRQIPPSACLLADCLTFILSIAISTFFFHEWPICVFESGSGSKTVSLSKNGILNFVLFTSVQLVFFVYFRSSQFVCLFQSIFHKHQQSPSTPQGLLNTTRPISPDTLHNLTLITNRLGSSYRGSTIAPQRVTTPVPPLFSFFTPPPPKLQPINPTTDPSHNQYPTLRTVSPPPIKPNKSVKNTLRDRFQVDSRPLTWEYRQKATATAPVARSPSLSPQPTQISPDTSSPLVDTLHTQPVMLSIPSFAPDPFQAEQAFRGLFIAQPHDEFSPHDSTFSLSWGGTTTRSTDVPTSRWMEVGDATDESPAIGYDVFGNTIFRKSRVFCPILQHKHAPYKEHRAPALHSEVPSSTAPNISVVRRRLDPVLEDHNLDQPVEEISQTYLYVLPSSHL